MKDSGARQQLTTKTIAYLESHYGEPFSLTDLAGALYVNKNYLARTFKEMTGMTLLQYHNRLRCDKARQLLKNPNYTIGVVAFKSGFSSASHFSRIFREYEGVTPSEYRRNCLP